MAQRSLPLAASALLFGAALFALAPPAAFALDKRPTGPTSVPPSHPPQPQSHPDRHEHRGRWLPPYCPPSAASVPVKPNISFEIRLLRVDAGLDAVPSVSAFLAATSNPDDQRAGLQEQARRGVRILQVSEGPTLPVKQDATGIRDLSASAIRVSAHPYLNAQCAEAIDFIVEQTSPGASQPETNAHISLVFENGDTKLLSETIRPDGARHLIYATVFFSPRLVPRPR